MDQHTSPSDEAFWQGDRSLQALVWRILRPTSEQELTSESLRAVAEEAYTHLRTRLSVSLGTLGFDALWLRAIQLALRQTTVVGAVGVPHHCESGSSGIAELGAQRDLQTFHDLLHALFTTFFGLLVTFIGEKLTLSMIYQLWPALGLNEAGPHIKEYDHE